MEKNWGDTPSATLNVKILMPVQGGFLEYVVITAFETYTEY